MWIEYKNHVFFFIYLEKKLRYKRTSDDPVYLKIKEKKDKQCRIFIKFVKEMRKKKMCEHVYHDNDD